MVFTMAESEKQLVRQGSSVIAANPFAEIAAEGSNEGLTDAQRFRPALRSGQARLGDDRATGARWRPDPPERGLSQRVRRSSRGPATRKIPRRQTDSHALASSVTGRWPRARPAVLLSGDRMRAEVLSSDYSDHSVRALATEYNKNIAGWKLSSRGRPFTPRAYTNTRNPQRVHGNHSVYAPQHTTPHHTRFLHQPTASQTALVLTSGLTYR